MYISSIMYKLLILFFNFFFFTLVISEILNDIKVKGNNRVSKKQL